MGASAPGCLSACRGPTTLLLGSVAKLPGSDDPRIGGGSGCRRCECGFLINGNKKSHGATLVAAAACLASRAATEVEADPKRHRETLGRGTTYPSFGTTGTGSAPKVAQVRNGQWRWLEIVSWGRQVERAHIRYWRGRRVILEPVRSIRKHPATSAFVRRSSLTKVLALVVVVPFRSRLKRCERGSVLLLAGSLQSCRWNEEMDKCWGDWCGLVLFLLTQCSVEPV